MSRTERRWLENSEGKKKGDNNRNSHHKMKTHNGMKKKP
jgi:hypothetical protein